MPRNPETKYHIRTQSQIPHAKRHKIYIQHQTISLLLIITLQSQLPSHHDHHRVSSLLSAVSSSLMLEDIFTKTPHSVSPLSPSMLQKSLDWCRISLNLLRQATDPAPRRPIALAGHPQARRTFTRCGAALSSSAYRVIPTQVAHGAECPTPPHLAPLHSQGLPALELSLQS